jgi:hypothetical protein
MDHLPPLGFDRIFVAVLWMLWGYELFIYFILKNKNINT